MLTGGQVSSIRLSLGPALGAPGAGWAGWSEDPPPNRLLKRSPSDCAATGGAKTLQPTASATTADTATTRYLRDGNAVMITCLLPIRRPWPHTSSNHHVAAAYSSAMAANPRRRNRHLDR